VVSAAIVGERVAIVGPREVSVLRVPSGDVLWRAMPSQGLDVVVHAHPISDDTVLLVGATGYSLTKDAQVFVRRADRSRGDWQITDTAIPDLTFVGACASAGDNLYLVGTWEDSRRVTGSGAQRPLLQRLKVVRVHVKTNVPVVVVDEPSFSYQMQITDAVAGEDLLALVVDRRELRVFRALGDESAVAPLRQESFKEPIAVSWLSRRRIALGVGDKSRIIDIP
jgi:hypothetical protein